MALAGSLNGASTDHDACDVAGFEFADGQVERLVHVGVDPLRHQAVQVDGAAQQLDVALFQQGLVAVGARVCQVRPGRHALGFEPFVQKNAATGITPAIQMTTDVGAGDHTTWFAVPDERNNLAAVRL